MLTRAVTESRSDDFVEIYNELFPEDPITEQAAVSRRNLLAQKVLDHMSEGLEIEEIIDLWNVIFPRHRDVYFDEDDGRVHYDEQEAIEKTE